MPTTAATPTALSVVRARRRAKERAEVDLLVSVLAWTTENLAAAGEPGETYCEGFYESDVALAGVGAPLVREFATYELGAALGLTSDAAQVYVGRALELKHRLPRLFAHVVAGKLTVYKAGRIADLTISLPIEGAAHVDRHLVSTAHQVGVGTATRLVEQARTRFDPAEAERRRLVAAEDRHVSIDLDQAGLPGTVCLTGILDVADALDLEQAIGDTAKHLGQLGCAESLDVRRSMALGELARTQLALDLDTGALESPGRAVTIYAHVNDHGATGVGSVDNTRSDALVTQIASWCATATKVTIKPVIDLAVCDPVTAYAIPERHHEVVRLRDRHCVFPYCHRPARGCDTDHTVPWPTGTTCPCNLAPLCRRHHRAKTHSAWTYTTLDPGAYLWRSPTGLRFLRDQVGTTDLTDDTDSTDPPGSPAET